MKVLSLIESFAHGGAETVATDLVLGMPEHDHRLAHFSAANATSVHEPFVRTLTASGVPVHDVHWSPHSGGLAWITAGGWIPDVVLAHWWRGDALSAWSRALAEMGTSPVSICVMHDSRGVAPTEFDWYVPVTPTQLHQVGDRRGDRVRVIPNGIDLQRFEGLARRAAVPGAPVVIGRLSNLRAEKFPVDWVAMAMGWQIPNARFVIAGDGPLLGTLSDAAFRLGAEDRLELPGYVSRQDVPAMLATFDVFCYVTGAALECHPLVVLEAAAAGLPIVAEPRGGITDIVEHEVSGLLGATSDEIGEHLRRLCAEPDLRARLGRNARTIAERYSLERQIDSYRALLAEATAVHA